MIESFTKKHPSTCLRFWAIHPIAILLTDSSLKTEVVIDLLDMVPFGTERQLIWDESQATISTLGRRREYPIDEETIKELADIGTTNAFLALLGRHRLHKLIGQFEFDDLYEFALMDCFAKVVGSDPHLCIAQNTLVTTFADYLQWPPGCGPEYLSGFDFGSTENKQYWAEVALQIRRSWKLAEADGVLMPPDNYVEKLNEPAEIF